MELPAVNLKTLLLLEFKTLVRPLQVPGRGLRVLQKRRTTCDFEFADLSNPILVPQVILLVHWLLTTWGCLVFSGSYAWGNFTILALGVWAVAQRDSIDAIGMFLGGLVATIFLDIIYISVFYSSVVLGDTGRFGAGMAILSLLLKPLSCCLVYHMHRERGGELPLRPDFFGPSQEHSAYQTIDSSDSPADPFASLENKGQAVPRGY